MRTINIENDDSFQAIPIDNFNIDVHSIAESSDSRLPIGHFIFFTVD